MGYSDDEQQRLSKQLYEELDGIFKSHYKQIAEILIPALDPDDAEQLRQLPQYKIGGNQVSILSIIYGKHLKAKLVGSAEAVHDFFWRIL